RCARLCGAARDRDSEALAVEALLHAFHLRLLGLLPVGVTIDRAPPFSPNLDAPPPRPLLRALEARPAGGECFVVAGELRARSLLCGRRRACLRLRLFGLQPCRRHHYRKTENGPGNLRHETSLSRVVVSLNPGSRDSSMDFWRPNAARARDGRAPAMHFTGRPTTSDIPNFNSGALSFVLALVEGLGLGKIGVGILHELRLGLLVAEAVGLALDRRIEGAIR